MHLLQDSSVRMCWSVYARG